MRHKKVLVLIATTLVIVGAIVGGYVFWQYRTSRPPALDSIPAYPSAVPVTDISEPQRDGAEAQLRDFASTARPGFHVVAERFLATNAQYTWDAVRHSMRTYLKKTSGYGVDDDGWTQGQELLYLVYGHHGLRRLFNDDVIVVAAIPKPITQTATGEDVHFYGYFRLATSG
jgi:hypothetical protein